MEQMEVNPEELRQLVDRAREAPLEEVGCRKLNALIDTFEYVTRLLEDKQTTIHALRQLLLKSGKNRESSAKGWHRSQRAEEPSGERKDARAQDQGARPQQCRVL